MKAQLLRTVSAAEKLRHWLLKQQWFTSRLLPALPRQVRWFLRWLYLAPIDVADKVLGRRRVGVPSKAGTFTGEVDDFAGSGEALVGALRDVAGLTPTSHVLDIGCGIGRLARAVSEFIDTTGGYEGLDIVPDGIRWCQENIVSPDGNVHFTLADIRNTEYNPKGKLTAEAYRFPYADESIDVVVLVSVFTHMLPAEVNQYVSEIARVLKKGGRVFATYFLITSESLAQMTSPGSKMKFKRDTGPHWFVSAKVPELATAYDEAYILELYAKHGLAERPDVYRGSWYGQPGHWPPESALGFQDTLVAAKRQ